MTRFLVLSLLIALNAGCREGHIRPAPKPYPPRPSIEFAAVVEGSRVVAVHIRHSRCNVVLRLSAAAENSNSGEGEPGYVLDLASSQALNFTGAAYRGFSRSIDLFEDGTVIVVPLSDTHETAGVFLNLLSGDRYFFAPAPQSEQSHARIRKLRKGREGLRGVKVVAAGDDNPHQSLPLFPEFEG